MQQFCVIIQTTVTLDLNEMNRKLTYLGLKNTGIYPTLLFNSCYIVFQNVYRVGHY